MVTRDYRRELFEKAHRLVGLLVIAILAFLLSQDSTWAHASLLSTTPVDGERLDSSPAEIVLEFSEPVGIVDVGTVLHGSNIETIDMSPIAQGSSVVVSVEQPLEDGAYFLQWRVISADSHPISGTLSFTIGETDAGSIESVTTEIPGWIEWARTVAVAIKYVGLLAGFGVLLVGFRLTRADLHQSMRIALLFAAFGLIGILTELPLAAVVQRGEVITDVPDLWAGIVALDSGTRIAALVGVLAVGLVVIGGSYVRGWLLPLALLTVGILSLVLSGHTRSQHPIWLMMVSDAVHVLSAAVWLGGIVLLTIGIRGRWRGEGFSTQEQCFEAVSRFSTLAGYTAIVVIVSGVAMALVILDSLDALYKTSYGVTLIFKFGLVILVLLLAAANRFLLIPGREHRSDFSLSWLRRLVSIELVVLIAVAGVTGALVHRDPNVQADTAVIQERSVVVFEGESALDSDHTVRVRISSDSRNEVTVIATIIDGDRNIVLPDANLHLSWYLPDRDLGPLSQELFLDTTTGAYIGTYSLPSHGEWELEIQIRIDRFTDSRTTIDVEIPD